MKSFVRYLITSSDERTWKFDRPVVFLGEWCRVYSRRHIWKNMDAVVAEPYGLGMAKKDEDYAEARALEVKLFPEFIALLNQHHGTQHGERFWRMVLGHWFQRVVDVMLNRVKTLEQCLDLYDISGTTTYESDHYTLATVDTYSAIWAFNDERWNNALTSRILGLLESVNFPIELVAEEGAAAFLPGFRFIKTFDAYPFKKRITKWGYQILRKLARRMASNNDAFIINSYLPTTTAIKLELALGQCPQMWAAPKLEINKNFDRLLRECLAKQFKEKKCDSLEYILRSLLFEMLPVCYLEGYSVLNKVATQQPWPKTPKFIYTCNNFDTDEVFKLWSAIKVESDCKYYIGQHGNNYGTHRYMFPTVEELTADKFLTWGWSDGLLQHTPAFLFKAANRKVRFNPQGRLLLIELHLNHRISTWDGTSEFVDFFNDQKCFVRGLANKPKQNLTIRLHTLYRYFNWSEESRWHSFDSKLKIDTGAAPIGDLIADSRLVVHGYDSTGILETLSQNIPTLAFWQYGLEHLRESAKPYYQLLVDAGIVHLSADSAAEKVNTIWDDVESWWEQSHVQDARKKFCDRYARVSEDPVRELKLILTQ